MAQFFSLYVFTSSCQEYADKIVSRLDPGQVIIKVLHREDCTFLEGNSYKDLRILKTGLKNTILLDNNDISFAMQPENGLLICDFIDDPQDREL